MGKAANIAMTSSRNIERSFTMMGTAIIAATGSAIGALGLLIDKTEDTVFQMQKMAQQAGVSVEAFSKLAYAAKTSGMPVEQMAVILTRIGHTAFEAASGNKQMAESYKALGVNVQDSNGHFKTADQLAIDMAKSLSQFKDSTAKTGIEVMLMGRSGAQAAEFMSVLATRFDEVSATAEKMGVVFNGQTAQSAQKLHDSLVMIEAAGLGLSVRLLNAVSPALQDVITKITEFVATTEGQQKIDAFGAELAKGITLAGNALEFLINHFHEVKEALEALVAIRLGGMFLPMVLSASSAAGGLGKLGIASGNLVGKLLGISRLGNVLAPVASGALESSESFVALSSKMGMAAASSLYLANMMAALRGIMATLVATVPYAALASGAVYEFLLAAEGLHNYTDLKNDTGASWWKIQIAEINEATSSLHNFLDALNMTFTGSQGATDSFYSGVAQRLGSKHPYTALKSNMTAPPSVPDGYKTNPAMGGQKLKDMAPLPQTGKVDQLAKKLDELKNHADEAKAALAAVGMSPQQARDAEILGKYNQFLIDQKLNLDKLSTSKQFLVKSQALESITTAINTEAAAKYATSLKEAEETTATATQEHLALAAAVGKSAQAMQDAMVTAKVSAEFQKRGGVGWQSDPKMVADAAERAKAIRAEMDTANKQSDTTALNSSQVQLEAQKRLNDAILQGAEAKRQAQILNDQAQVVQDFHSRGDNDTVAMQAQIAAVREKSDAESDASDLERAAAMDSTLRYQEELKSIEDATTAAREHGQALDFTSVLAADKEAWEQFKESQDKATLAVGGAMDGLKVSLDQMARDTTSAAQQVYDAVNRFVSSMNDTIAKVLTEHHQRGTHYVSQAFSGTFRGLGDQMMQSGLKKAESGVLKGFGLGKPDGTQGNPWYVKLVGMGASNYGVGGAAGMNELGRLLGGSSSSSNGANGAGNGVGSVIGTAAKLLLPMFADGTDSTIAGMPSWVGEKGPELFIPPSAGAIVPNSKLRNGFGGDTHHWNIDARGAHDPAQTVAVIDQYMKKAAPQIAAHTIKAIHEQHVRVPGTARR